MAKGRTAKKKVAKKGAGKASAKLVKKPAKKVAAKAVARGVKVAAKAAVTTTGKVGAAMKPVLKTAAVKTSGAKKAMARRDDLMAPVSVAIEGMVGASREIGRALDKTIREVAAGAEGVVKWGNACYFTREGEGKPRYFATFYETKAGCNLGIPGAGLDDPHGLLQGTGKSMRHVKVGDVALARDERLKALLRQGLAVGFERM